MKQLMNIFQNRRIMKQYLNSEQTAKLIELGFEKPKNEVKAEQAGDYAWYNPAYSIGELIEMLPEYSSIFDLADIETQERHWYVGHVSTLNVSSLELIDALYAMILRLKEEGVI